MRRTFGRWDGSAAIARRVPRRERSRVMRTGIDHENYISKLLNISGLRRGHGPARAGVLAGVTAVINGVPRVCPQLTPTRQGVAERLDRAAGHANPSERGMSDSVRTGHATSAWCDDIEESR